MSRATDIRPKLELNHNFPELSTEATFARLNMVFLFPLSFPVRYPDTTDTAAAISQLGCKHVSKSVGESHVDEKNKLVTTCAFMCNAPIHKVFDGIGVLVMETLKLA